MSQRTRRAARGRVRESQATAILEGGLRPARDGFQPVQDLAAFLDALPEFGEDAERLCEVIEEDRASRRAAVSDSCS